MPKYAGGNSGGTYNGTSGRSGGSASPIPYGQAGMQSGLGYGAQGMQGLYFRIMETDGKKLLKTYEGIMVPINLPYNGNGQMMPGSSIDGKVNDYKTDPRMALPLAGGPEMYDPLKDPKAQGVWANQAGLMNGGKYNEQAAGEAAAASPAKRGGNGTDKKKTVAQDYALRSQEYQKENARAQGRIGTGARPSQLERTIEEYPLAV